MLRRDSSDMLCAVCNEGSFVFSSRSPSLCWGGSQWPGLFEPQTYEMACSSFRNRETWPAIVCLCWSSSVSEVAILLSVLYWHSLYFISVFVETEILLQFKYLHFFTLRYILKLLLSHTHTHTLLAPASCVTLSSLCGWPVTDHVYCVPVCSHSLLCFW